MRPRNICDSHSQSCVDDSKNVAHVPMLDVIIRCRARDDVVWGRKNAGLTSLLRAAASLRPAGPQGSTPSPSSLQRKVGNEWEAFAKA